MKIVRSAVYLFDNSHRAQMRQTVLSSQILTVSKYIPMDVSAGGRRWRGQMELIYMHHPSSSSRGMALGSSRPPACNACCAVR